MMKRTVRILTVLILFGGIVGALVSPAALAAPNRVNYQGSLTDSGGTPVTDPSVSMTFRIYNDPTLTAPANKLWEETQTVNVMNGIYNVLLGSGTTITGSFDPGLFSTNNLWLEVEVNAEVLTPRQQMASVAFALQAQEAVTAGDADTVDGSHAADFAGASHTHSGTDITSQVGDADTVDGAHAAALEESAEIDADIVAHAGNASAHHAKTTSFTDLADQATDAQLPAAIARDAEIMPTVLAGDGSGSTLDADLLDGLNSSAFMSSGTDNWVNITGDTMIGGLNVLANVGIGTTTPSEALTVAGTIESTSGGIKFPDGTIQSTTANAQNVVVVDQAGSGFTTIQAAIDSITPSASNPYVIEVKPGNYTEDITMKSYIHLKGSGMDGTLIAPLVAGNRAVTSTSLSGVEISGFTFAPDPNPLVRSTGFGIYDDGSSPVVTDCYFTRFDNGGAGIFSTNSSPKIQRNEFVDNGGNGVWLEYVLNGDVSENKFDINYSQDGLKVLWSIVRISGNSFSNQTGYGVSIKYGHPAYSTPEQWVDVLHNVFTNGGGGISALNVGKVNIIGNNITDGPVQVSGEEARIIGNYILGGPDTISSSTKFAEIANNHIWGGSNGIVVGTASVASTITGNIIRSDTGIDIAGGEVEIVGNHISPNGVGIRNSGSARIQGNRIVAGGSAAGIVDEGEAEIIGNSIETLGSVGIDNTLSTATEFMIWGNRVTQGSPDTVGQRIITPAGIRIESTGDSIVISAGSSEIQISPTGAITIQGSSSVNINATGDLNLTGANVNITSTLNTKIKANGVLYLESGANTDMTAGGSTTMTAGSILDLNGAMINLN